MSPTVERQHPPGDVSAGEKIVDPVLWFIPAAFALHEVLRHRFFAIVRIVVLIEFEERRSKAVDLGCTLGSELQCQIVLCRLTRGVGDVFLAALAAFIVSDVNNVGMRIAAWLHQRCQLTVQLIGYARVDPHHLFDDLAGRYSVIVAEPGRGIVDDAAQPFVSALDFADEQFDFVLPVEVATVEIPTEPFEFIQSGVPGSVRADHGHTALQENLRNMKARSPAHASDYCGIDGQSRNIRGRRGPE